MNKTELINELAKQTELTKKDCAKILNEWTEVIKKALKKGKKVQLIGFGSFEVKKRKARMGRNPVTGKPIKIKATKVPKFRPGKAFKDKVAKR